MGQIPFSDLLWFANTIGISDAELADICKVSETSVWGWRVNAILPHSIEGTYNRVYIYVKRRLEWIEKEKSKWSW